MARTTKSPSLLHVSSWFGQSRRPKFFPSAPHRPRSSHTFRVGSKRRLCHFGCTGELIVCVRTAPCLDGSLRKLKRKDRLRGDERANCKQEDLLKRVVALNPNAKARGGALDHDQIICSRDLIVPISKLGRRRDGGDDHLVVVEGLLKDEARGVAQLAEGCVEQIIGCDLERHGHRGPRGGDLMVERQKVVIEHFAALDRVLASVAETACQDHRRATELDGFIVYVAKARGCVLYMVCNADRARAHPRHRPLTSVDNFVCVECIVAASVLRGAAKHAIADDDKGPVARLRLVVSNRREFVDWPSSSAGKPCHNRVALELPISDTRIRPIEPKPVILMTLMYQAGNDRLLEARPLIEAVGLAWQHNVALYAFARYRRAWPAW
mmetsp:Transcript_31674/g.82779  ORF Transcript_31674/g.82779 Transcript_31674/m.82779 type:complete len:381 (-) Transcript_31674:155-1297(-)